MRNENRADEIRTAQGWLGRLFLILFLVLVAAPVALLLLFRFVPLPGTPQMLVSLIEGKGAHYAWADQLPPILGKSVIGSEDQNFCSHHGFDWKSIDQAMAAHERDPSEAAARRQHHLAADRADLVPGSRAQLGAQRARRPISRC